MKKSIRCATENDLDFCLELDEIFFEKFIIEVDGKFDKKLWLNFLKKDQYRTYILEIDSKPAGYYRYSILKDEDNNKNYIYLRVIAIFPEYQKLGLGNFLYEDFEQRICANNFNIIKLSCPSYLDSIEWYPQKGFLLDSKDEKAHHFSKKLK